jgi:hypothetical protein
VRFVGIVTALAALVAAPTASAETVRIVPQGDPPVRLAAGVSATKPISDGRRAIVVTRTKDGSFPFLPGRLVIVDTATGRHRAATGPRDHGCIPRTGGGGQVVVACQQGLYLLSTATARMRRIPGTSSCATIPGAIGEHWLLLAPDRDRGCDAPSVALAWRTGRRVPIVSGTAVDVEAAAYTAAPNADVGFTRHGRYVEQRVVDGRSLVVALFDRAGVVVLGSCELCFDDELTGANRVSWMGGIERWLVSGYPIAVGRRPEYRVPIPHDAIHIEEAVAVTNTDAALVISTVRHYEIEEGPDAARYPYTWRVWVGPWR